jgi:hypothetical protein
MLLTPYRMFSLCSNQATAFATTLLPPPPAPHPLLLHIIPGATLLPIMLLRLLKVCHLLLLLLLLHFIFDSVNSTRLLTTGSNLTRCSLYGTLRGFFFVT